MVAQGDMKRHWVRDWYARVGDGRGILKWWPNSVTNLWKYWVQPRLAFDPSDNAMRARVDDGRGTLKWWPNSVTNLWKYWVQSLWKYWVQYLWEYWVQSRLAFDPLDNAIHVFILSLLAYLYSLQDKLVPFTPTLPPPNRDGDKARGAAQTQCLLQHWGSQTRTSLPGSNSDALTISKLNTS